MRRRDGLLFAAGLAVLALAVGVSSLRLGRREPSSPPAVEAGSRTRPSEVRTLFVPRVREAVVLDGELNEPMWTTKVARTEGFTDALGRPGKPYSDARFAWGDDKLFIALYAADDDIQADPLSRLQSIAPGDDRFHLELGRGADIYEIEINPLGIYATTKRSADATAGVAWDVALVVGHDLDGTANDPSDDDEEWLLEFAIPLSAFGARSASGEQFNLFVERCDTPHRAKRSCNAWTTRAAPSRLVLE